MKHFILSRHAQRTTYTPAIFDCTSASRRRAGIGVSRSTVPRVTVHIRGTHLAVRLVVRGKTEGGTR
jgi:hypothetical protein